MIAVTRDPIDVSALMERLDRSGAGSVVTHLGIVKPDPEGKKSSGLALEASGDMEAELAEIEARLRSAFKLIDVVLVRRLGELGIGDYILFGAISANDRVNAFAACRELVESCKRLKTLKKKEHFKD